MILTTFIFAIQDTLTKYLALNVPVMQFVGLRFLVFFLFALWWSTRHQPLKKVLAVKQPKIQLLRGLLLILEILLFSFTIRYMGVGEMQSLFITYPLLITAFSPWVLGEAVGWRRWMAVSIGFIGMLVIISPNSMEFNIYSVLALICALMFAFYGLLTRVVSRTDSTESSLLYNGIAGLAITLPFLPFSWQALNPDLWIFIGVICATGVLSHYLMIKAITLVPPVILQPFNYLILPWAILLGFFFFDEVIPAHKWYGIALVVGSGLYVAFRQRQLKGI